MKSARTVIVFGISGVGKSYACSNFVQYRKDFVHKQASHILTDATGLSRDQLRKTDAETIIHRQELIAEYINHFRSLNPGLSLLIDGHSVIDNGAEIVNIGLKSIQVLNPDGIVHLTASAETIFQRRNGDNRPRPVRSIQELELHQRKSSRAAFDFSEALEIPFILGSAVQPKAFAKMIDALIYLAPSSPAH